MLFGVHDGVINGNTVGYVELAGATSAVGIYGWGVQRVSCADNVLNGGAGPDSAGISFIDAAAGGAGGLAVTLASEGNMVSSNTIRNFARQTTR